MLKTSLNRGCPASRSHSKATISVVTSSAPAPASRSNAGVAVALGARAAGVGHHPDLQLLLQQAQRGLQQAHVGLAAGQHDRLAPGAWAGARLLQVLGQAADVAALLARRRA
jgi:hypothetical protein